MDTGGGMTDCDYQITSYSANKNVLTLDIAVNYIKTFPDYWLCKTQLPIWLLIITAPT